MRWLLLIAASSFFATSAWAQTAAGDGYVPPSHPLSRGLSVQTPGQMPPAIPRNCGADERVWVVGGQQTFLTPGSRSYGQGRGGRYLCRLEAERAGYTQAKSGG